ncbi:monocarboxylate transporter 3-like [Strongylocentrotus purpuratus]|uniref:Monocarboxylate transporter n=1 Tax=Strongylocentrotus purpuratus TaxID=7668 RepID=A0A7M7PCF0_STRPU|nr:monocarboxylate transporter 3-like [Strongylocentrotus purpuratus]
MKEVNDYTLALDEKKVCGYENIPVRLIKDGPFVTLVLPGTNHRVVAMSGGLLCGSCIIACAFCNNAVSVGVCLALSGVGLSMTYMPVVIALNDFFKGQFVLVNTIASYGFIAGSMVLPVIMERSFEAYGYAGAFVILGGIALNLVVCGATIRNAPSNAATNEGESHDKVNQESSEQIEGIHYEDEDNKEEEKEEHNAKKENEEKDDSEDCVSEQQSLIPAERRTISILVD